MGWEPVQVGDEQRAEGRRGHEDDEQQAAGQLATAQGDVVAGQGVRGQRDDEVERADRAGRRRPGQGGEPVGAEGHGGGQGDGEREEAAAGLGEADGDDDQLQGDEPGQALGGAAVGRQREDERDRRAEAEQQRQRVPVVERRLQARVRTRLVEVDQPGDVEPRDDLLGQRVGQDDHGEGKETAGRQVDRVASTGAEGDGQGEDQRVAEDAVDLDPGAVGAGAPGEAQRAPGAEGEQQPEGGERRLGSPQGELAEPQPGGRCERGDDRDPHLQARLVRGADRALGEGRVQRSRK